MFSMKWFCFRFIVVVVVMISVWLGVNYIWDVMVVLFMILVSLG